MVEEFFTKSKYGTLRGLHFQTKNPQKKLINVIKGKIFDVAVDLRVGSVTYGKHFGVELSSENNMMLLIPEEFAHGFLSLEEGTIISYLCSNEYEEEFDTGIVYDDSDLNVQWPRLDVDFLISDRDKSFPRFKDFKGFR
jgi:dTDP-4-dehydrorhamnose 3,5-epimerase